MIGILPRFTGVRVHHGWVAYHAQATCHRARCNIHHLRELAFLKEAHQQTWAKYLKVLSLESLTLSSFRLNLLLARHEREKW
jgi:transposase